MGQLEREELINNGLVADKALDSDVGENAWSRSYMLEIQIHRGQRVIIIV